MRTGVFCSMRRAVDGRAKEDTFMLLLHLSGAWPKWPVTVALGIPVPSKAPFPLCGHDLTLPSKRSRSSISFAASSPAVIRRAATTAQNLGWELDTYTCCVERYSEILVDSICARLGRLGLAWCSRSAAQTYEKRAKKPRLAYGEQYLAY